ncbi:hypothetical protein C8F04DRAFT_1181924 [Mycena alexandri]|uniref:Uncharacterized protein n=1 Tax=Mycena alexandri TaxID=1745969 RepID=A0AAD6SXZ2_9AGAR|nr:hypothetical protein C8F04DRAFT_1181924 [Mycena alexandri]
MDDPNTARRLLLLSMAETRLQYDLDAFNVRDDAVNEVLHAVDTVEAAMAQLYHSPHPKLPRIVIQAHGKYVSSLGLIVLTEKTLDEKLNWARQRLEELDSFILPYKISQEIEFVEKTAPELSTLRAVYPLRYDPKPEKRFIRTVTYIERNQPAIQGRWWVPDLRSFVPNNYPGPPNGGSWSSDFEYYSPHSDNFFSIGDPIDLHGFGRILIFRKVGLSKFDCLHLDEWQQLALESCGNDEADESLLTDASSPPAPAASPLPPSSPPSLSPVSPTRIPSSDGLWAELDKEPKKSGYNSTSSPPRPSLPVPSSPPFAPYVLSAWSPYPRSLPEVDNAESPSVPRTSVKRKPSSSPSPVARVVTKQKKLDAAGVDEAGVERESASNDD